MAPEDELQSLLHEHGAVLERSKKHKVYRFPDGRIFVQPNSGSDKRGVNNAICDLRKLLGVRREVHKNPDRKEKKGTVKPLYCGDGSGANRDWKTALNLALAVLPTWKPKPCCTPLDVRRVPMTPLWAIMRNLIGYGGIQ